MDKKAKDVAIRVCSGIALLLFFTLNESLKREGIYIGGLPFGAIVGTLTWLIIRKPKEEKREITISEENKKREVSVSEKNKESPLKGIALTVLGVFAFALLAGFLVNIIESKESSQSFNNTETILKRISEEINKKTPMTVDADTRLDSVVSAENELIYKYSLINISLKVHPIAEVQENILSDLRPRLVNGICYGPSMKSLRERNVEFSYIYYDKEGFEITTLTVKSSECNEN